MNYLKRLNPKQLEAVMATEGRVLVLAGAGSGKTSVLIARIAYLIGEKKVDPTEILGLTFTNKAAREMRERLSKMIGKKLAEQVTLLTFHSFCYHLLREEIHRLGYTKQFSIYDEREMKRLVTGLSGEGEPPMSLETAFETIKSVRSGSELDLKEPKHKAFVAEMLDELEGCMRAYNAVDFDSMLTLTLRLFQEHPEVLSACQNKFRYIMIDEYQDTNPVQFSIAQALSKKHGNLCVVGDDDQSIYGWRGAKVSHILEFKYDTLVKLEQNYRSTPRILTTANKVIANNRDRHDKELWSDKRTGNPIHIFHAPTDEGEAEAVVQRMLLMRRELTMRWSDMAILYRSNVLARPFEKVMMKTVWEGPNGYVRGIPYTISEGTEFYQRAEVKDFVAYLRVVSNPSDTEAVLRIINYPRRGISAQTLDKLTQYNRKAKRPLWDILQQVAHGLFEDVEISKQGGQGIRAFVSLIERAQGRFQTEAKHDAAKWLFAESGYKEAIIKDVKSEQAQQFRWENIKQCLDMIEEDPSDDLHEFLATSMLDPAQKEQFTKKNDDRVQLMTFHSAKGLEFPACFLVCLEDHVLPHEKSLLETGIEEERRLLYVAITRAEKFLTMSMARKRLFRGKEVATNPSRFLHELPKDELKVGTWNFPDRFEQ